MLGTSNSGCPSPGLLGPRLKTALRARGFTGNFARSIRRLSPAARRESSRLSGGPIRFRVAHKPQSPLTYTRPAIRIEIRSGARGRRVRSCQGFSAVSNASPAAYPSRRVTQIPVHKPEFTPRRKPYNAIHRLWSYRTGWPYTG